MRKVICCALLVTASTIANSADKRPKITGIDHVDFYTTSPDANDEFYTRTLGLASVTPIEPRQTRRFVVGDQFVGYSPAIDLHTKNRMDHVAFTTDNAAALRAYLIAKGIEVTDGYEPLSSKSRTFQVKDPEGHRIEFVQRSTPIVGGGFSVGSAGRIKDDSISRHMIHVGFIVHHREAEDHFYRDILGFHLYWQGGMKADKTDWAAMQVPDGTDWLEYMLNVEPDPDQHTMGVMNHISLGVRDIKEAQTKLESHGWKPHGDEKAQIGRDGKWQLNLYDPDFTRIEMMEFKPVQKPCCSEFQGQHPSEQ
jgi:catechol 2,3-dioxygenase-like lactoylglutathione lyase family enzyme